MMYAANPLNPPFASRCRQALVFLWLVAAAAGISGCRKYLEVKPDKKLVVPGQLQDAQALLDNFSTLNGSYPSLGAQSDDDFYLLPAYYNAINITNRNNYVWAPEAMNNNEWNSLYRMVLVANVALETLEKAPPAAFERENWNRTRGTAFFFRAQAFYHLAQYYAPPYEKGKAESLPGIPLRLNSNGNVASTRSSLEATYRQVIQDLQEAATLLPPAVSLLSRPSKAAAFGALARTYLLMEDYSEARRFADSCLHRHPTLIDYNTLNAAATVPFTRYNPEVIFHSVLLGTGMLGVNNWRVDSLLYRSYAADDLRRTLFFRSNGSGTFGFRGSYDGTVTANHFNGIAADEIYLIRAECHARLGALTPALEDLNTLLEKRWRTGSFVPLTAATADEALLKILEERRKELVLRSTRWIDLRRLNKEPRFQKTLVRQIDNNTYSLPPGDPRYTFLIPQVVIELSGIQQNPR